MDTPCAAMLAFAAVMAFASTPSPAEETPQAARFDFWLGNWDLTSNGQPAGTNTITREYGGSVIMERFVGTGAARLEGLSVSVFNPNTGKWQQTWVDNQGGYLDFTGEFSGDRMVLSRRATIQGKEVLQRMVWCNIEPDSFDWNWERSDDNGATWQTVWPIHYVRRKE